MKIIEKNKKLQLKTDELGKIEHDIKNIKCLGFKTWSNLIDKKEDDVRIDIVARINELVSKKEDKKINIDVEWSLIDWSSKKEWIQLDQPNYNNPEVIIEISELLHLFFLEIMISTYKDMSLKESIEDIERLTNEYTELAKLKSEAALSEIIDPHACIHILEVMTTYNMTIIQFVDSLMGYPNKMDFETRPTKVDFVCHPAIGGLTVSEYIFNDDYKKRASQKPRSPSSKTNRVGQNISFEELSNIYRTSRVTLANMYNRTLSTFKKKLQVIGVSDHNSI